MTIPPRVILHTFILTSFLHQVISNHLSVANRSELPAWNIACGFTALTSNVLPHTHLSSFVDSVVVGNEVACENFCKPDSRCGMYVWESTSRLCAKSQQSVLMWIAAGLSENEIFAGGTSGDFRIGSRDCDAAIDTSCSSYPVTRDRQTLDRSEELFVVSYVLTSSVNSAAPANSSQCQALCSQYSACKGVMHIVDAQNDWGCYLYYVTITQLLANGGSASVFECPKTGFPTCTFYERECTDPDKKSKGAAFLF